MALELHGDGRDETATLMALISGSEPVAYRGEVLPVGYIPPGLTIGTPGVRVEVVRKSERGSARRKPREKAARRRRGGK